MGYQAPIAEVITSEQNGPLIRTVLRVGSPQPPPAAPASLISLEDPQIEMLALHRVVERNGDLLTFETYDDRAKPLQSGARYYFQLWWAPWSTELVQDSTKQWRRQQFAPTDSVRYAGGPIIVLDLTRPHGGLDESLGEGEMIPGGWDHEHCSLCGTRISLYEGDQHIGYTDGHDWVCEACYQTYITSGLGQKLGETL